MTTPVMLAYVGDATVTGTPAAGVLPNWATNQLYFIMPGTTGAGAGIRQFTAYPSGTQTLAKVTGTIGIPEIETISGGGASLSYNNQLLSNQFTSNSTTLAEIYAPTLALIAQAFVSGSGTCASGTSCSGSTTNRILTSYSMIPLRYGLVDFMLSCSLRAVGEVCVLSLPGLNLTNLGDTDEGNAVCGRGAINATSGTAFVLGYASGITTTAVGLYIVTVSASGASMVKLGTIAPSAVDATWSHFSQKHGCAYDQTDGNPIVLLGTTDAVANQNYFVKLNKASGAIIWKCAVNNPDAYADADLPQHSIKNQKLFYLGSGNVLYTINTNTGAATTQTISSLSPSGGQVSEDTNESLVLQANWVDTGTTPTYIGDYMGTGGHHTLAGVWCRFFPGGVVGPTPPTPPAVPQEGIVSINRAWTYTQDGHTFYVIDLGTQGTFAYDMESHQWSEYQTAGGNWNMLNGIMWNQRVVGGDPTTTDVWELDPGAVTDAGGAYEISHIVTGGLSTRSRVYIACDAVRISASFGLVGDNGATFNLRFSDDQGNSWSDYFSITLLSGQFDEEIAWRSLGSFMAPGRIFEFSDVGGLIRIDGADAFLDGFDNDQQSQDAEGS